MKTPALKFLVLRLLEERPKSGYELMKEIRNLLGVSYPGSVYPILRWWEERGIVEKGDKYRLTEKGRALLKELERRKEKYVNMVRKDLLALSRALKDPELETFASLLPITDKLSKEGRVLLLSVLETLLSCEKRTISRLRRTLKDLRDCA